MSSTSGTARLALRLTRRSGVALAACLWLYAFVEVLGLRTTYPDAASRARLTRLASGAAVRVLQGVPDHVTTVGGYLAWDAGWVVATALGIWVLLAVTRLLVGDEESGRAEQVLGAPLTPATWTVVTTAVCIAIAVAAAAGVGVIAAVAGGDWAGSGLLALHLAGTTAGMAGLAAVASQVYPSRRRAVAVGSSALGIGFVLRMVADSEAGWTWLRWATPYGWLENLRPYGDVRWLVVVLELVVPAALLAVALALRRRRDVAAGAWSPLGQRQRRPRLLGGPAAWSWRQNAGVLVGWTLTVGGYAAVLGALLPTVVDFVTSDPSYQKTLRQAGALLAHPREGILGYFGVLLAVIVAGYAAWRAGAAAHDELAGRADMVLATPTSARRWFLAQAGTAAVAVVVLTTVTGAALWVGAAAAGAGLGAGSVVGAVANGLPLAALFLGLTLLVVAVLPRVAQSIGVVALVACYLWQVVATMAELPAWARDLSPVQHLAQVPAQSWSVAGGLAMLAAAALAVAAGAVVVGRRDVRAG